MGPTLDEVDAVRATRALLVAMSIIEDGLCSRSKDALGPVFRLDEEPGHVTSGATVELAVEQRSAPSADGTNER